MTRLGSRFKADPLHLLGRGVKATSVVLLALTGVVVQSSIIAAQGSMECPGFDEFSQAGQSAVMTHVRFLTDDRLAGRQVGSAGERCAAAYIEAQFQELGLVPAGTDGFYQAFRVRTGSELGSHNVLTLGSRSFELGQSWSPLGFSGTGMAEGSLRVVDRGALEERPPELAGSIAVIDIERDNVDAHFVASLAARAGAGGVILRLPNGGLPEVTQDRRPALSIPVAAIAGEAGGALASAIEGGTPGELMAQVTPTWGEAYNLAGMLVGSAGPYAPTIVVGAHYDHLGLGGEGSLSPGDYGQIHNGADENASGTAALIEVARELASSDPLPYNVLFLAFSGEERGLWGSAHFVQEPTVALNRVQAMLNMDMVGRLGEGKLTVFGVGTAEEWPNLLEQIIAHQPDPIPFVTAPDGYGPSDHSSFYGEGIPVLHFFTNTHEDYHRPSDDWQHIDAMGLERVASLVAGVTATLAGAMGEPMTLTRITGQGTPTVASSPEEGEASTSRGYGPYFGSIPDMTPFEGEGVRLTGVREGSPAAVAGLLKGDVIVEFGGLPVTDLYAYTYALGEFSPGDEVEVVVMRDGQRVSVNATLERR